MDLSFAYQKKRSEFGRQCLFSDKGPELIDDFPSNKKKRKEFILKDPFSRSQQKANVFAEHYLNTTRAEFSNSGMNHTEGGWPKDVNCHDDDHTKRYRRKIEKEDNWYYTCMQLFKSMEGKVTQNNAINIYQQYFTELEPMPVPEKRSGRIVNLYQDPTTPTRPINHISWSPDLTRFAVTHCSLKFQSKDILSPTSYIWEVENPNRPLHRLKAEDPAVCLEYNVKDIQILVSGQMSGQVALWDLRKGNKPAGLSLRETSFLDPVQCVRWINSKTNSEFFSAAGDGMVKWWDTRNLSKPTDDLILDYCREKDQRLSNALGASVLEYETTIPTRFIVGTEQGMIVMGNRKGKNAIEKMAYRIPGAHLGPIKALQRNPQFLKNFLTVGNWTAKIWSEDCRESAIIWTSRYKAFLTHGAWSPTRLSTFFTTRSDGILDVWDILANQKKAIISMIICDKRLNCLRTHDKGRLLAVGAESGTAYLVELTNNLAQTTKNEKLLLIAMFEREARREKILEARTREIRLKQKAGKMAQTQTDEEGEERRPSTQSGQSGQATKDTFNIRIKVDEDNFFDDGVMNAKKEFFAKLSEERSKRGIEEPEPEAVEEEESEQEPSTSQTNVENEELSKPDLAEENEQEED